MSNPRRRTPPQFPPARPLRDGTMRIAIARDQIGFAVAGPDEGWMQRGTCEVIDGAVVLVTLCIAPWAQSRRSGLEGLIEAPAPATRLGSDEMRRVRIPALERAVYDALAEAAASERTLAADVARLEKRTGLPLRRTYSPSTPAGDVLRIAPKHGAKRGRRGHGDEFYRWVAHRYIDIEEGERKAVEPPEAGGIFERIAEEAFEQGKTPYKIDALTAKKWVWQARKREFLPPTKPGQKSSGPGPGLYAQSDVPMQS